MLFIVSAVWFVMTILAFINGRRALASFSLILGAVLVYALFTAHLGYAGLAALGVLAIVLAVTNKIDML